MDSFYAYGIAFEIVGDIPRDREDVQACLKPAAILARSIAEQRKEINATYKVTRHVSANLAYQIVIFNNEPHVYIFPSGKPIKEQPEEEVIKYVKPSGPVPVFEMWEDVEENVLPQYLVGYYMCTPASWEKYEVFQELDPPEHRTANTTKVRIPRYRQNVREEWLELPLVSVNDDSFDADDYDGSTTSNYTPMSPGDYYLVNGYNWEDWSPDEKCMGFQFDNYDYAEDQCPSAYPSFPSGYCGLMWDAYCGPCCEVLCCTACPIPPCDCPGTHVWNSRICFAEPDNYCFADMCVEACLHGSLQPWQWMCCIKVKAAHVQWTHEYNCHPEWFYSCSTVSKSMAYLQTCTYEWPEDGVQTTTYTYDSSYNSYISMDGEHVFAAPWAVKRNYVHTFNCPSCTSTTTGEYTNIGDEIWLLGGQGSCVTEAGEHFAYQEHWMVMYGANRYDFTYPVNASPWTLPWFDCTPQSIVSFTVPYSKRLYILFDDGLNVALEEWPEDAYPDPSSWCTRIYDFHGYPVYVFSYYLDWIYTGNGTKNYLRYGWYFPKPDRTEPSEEDLMLSDYYECTDWCPSGPGTSCYQHEVFDSKADGRGLAYGLARAAEKSEVKKRTITWRPPPIERRGVT